MDICSPKDGFIVDLHVKEGDEVKQNDNLLDLDTDAEDRALVRIQATDDMRALRTAQFSGPELALLRELAQIAVDLTAQDLANKTRDLALAQKQDQLGVGTPAATSQATNDHISADLQHKRAIAQQKQLEFAVKRHDAGDKIGQQTSTFQRKQIHDRRDRMRVAAPMSGKVHLLVAKGSFAELGSTILTIS